MLALFSLRKWVCACFFTNKRYVSELNSYNSVIKKNASPISLF